MAEFKLERFKYNWKGVWTAASYNRDDVVNVGGKTYVCLITPQQVQTLTLTYLLQYRQ